MPEFLAESLQRTPRRESAIVTDFPNVSALIDQLLQSSSEGQLYDAVIAAIERILFTHVLEYTHGNQGKACELSRIESLDLAPSLGTLGLALDKVPIEAPRKEPSLES